MATKSRLEREKVNMKGFPHTSRGEQLKDNPRKSPYDWKRAKKRRKMAKESRRINRGN